MSLMIELASFVCGAMSEYALQKAWGSFKIFTITFFVLFTMFAVYFLLFPPVKGLVFALAGAAILALGVGALSTLLIRYAIRRKQVCAHEHLLK